jgi:hypothetical protein
MMLSVFALIISASLLTHPGANARQPSVMIDQLTADAKDLPLQSFPAF